MTFVVISLPFCTHFPAQTYEREHLLTRQKAKFVILDPLHKLQNTQRLLQTTPPPPPPKEIKPVSFTEMFMHYFPEVHFLCQTGKIQPSGLTITLIPGDPQSNKVAKLTQTRTHTRVCEHTQRCEHRTEYNILLLFMHALFQLLLSNFQCHKSSCITVLTTR